MARRNALELESNCAFAIAENWHCVCLSCICLLRTPTALVCASDICGDGDIAFTEIELCDGCQGCHFKVLQQLKSYEVLHTGFHDLVYILHCVQAVPAGTYMRLSIAKAVQVAKALFRICSD